ncbi:hypothetical protein J6590_003741 [Homalodisca vitripennis]|nr:hypothetical protein J6590_003741 [Homalodisca vitripennis]
MGISAKPDESFENARYSQKWRLGLDYCKVLRCWEWKRFLYVACRFYDVGSGSGSGTWPVGFTMLGVEAVPVRGV